MVDIVNLTPGELALLLEKPGVFLVDVREPGEFGAGHIGGAQSFPLSCFDPAALPVPDPAGCLVFYCAGGVRSARALAACRAAGLPHNRHLAGGVGAWKAAALPLVVPEI